MLSNEPVGGQWYFTGGWRWMKKELSWMLNLALSIGNQNWWILQWLSIGLATWMLHQFHLFNPYYIRIFSLLSSCLPNRCWMINSIPSRLWMDSNEITLWIWHTGFKGQSINFKYHGSSLAEDYLACRIWAITQFYLFCCSDRKAICHCHIC